MKTNMETLEPKLRSGNENYGYSLDEQGTKREWMGGPEKDLGMLGGVEGGSPKPQLIHEAGGLAGLVSLFWVIFRRRNSRTGNVLGLDQQQNNPPSLSNM